MKTLILRRGIFISLGIIVLLLFVFIFNDADDSSDILSDSHRQSLKSQTPNHIGQQEYGEIERPKADPIYDIKVLSDLESQIGALHENIEEFSSLNRDDSQGLGFS